MSWKIEVPRLVVLSVIAFVVACGSGDGDGDGGTDVRVASLEASDGAEGFLWKPMSDSNRRLVVLLPSSFNETAGRVEIHREPSPSETSFVEIGAFAGIGNGNRSHWRFTQAGGSYGPNVFVLVFTHVGEVFSYSIANGQHRID